MSDAAPSNLIHLIRLGGSLRTLTIIAVGVLVAGELVQLIALGHRQRAAGRRDCGAAGSLHFFRRARSDRDGRTRAAGCDLQSDSVPRHLTDRLI